jgi:MFS family permease
MHPSAHPTAPAGLVTLLLVNVFCHIPYNAGRTVSQVWMLEEHRSSTAVGAVAMLYALPMLLLAIPVGRWIDRRGVGLAACLGPGLVCAGLAVLVWRTLSAYAAGALLIGAGFCLWYVAATACVGRTMPATQRLSTYGLLTFSFSVSALAAAGVTGVAAAGQGGSALGLLLLSALTAGLLVVGRSGALRSLFDCTRQTTDLPTAAATRLPVNGGPGPLFAVALLAAMAWDTLLFGLPVLAHESGHVSALGWILAAFACSAAVGRLLAMVLLAQQTIALRLGLCLAVVAAGMALLGMSSQPATLAASAALCGWGLGMLQPYVLDAVCELSPEAVLSRNLGVLSVILAVSAVVVPLTIGAGRGLVSVASICTALSAGALTAVAAVAAWQWRLRLARARSVPWP